MARDQTASAASGLEFGYDPMGRRTCKKVFGPDGNGWTQLSHRKFADDGWNLVAQFLVGSTGTQRLIRSYAWGADLGGGTGGLLSITDHGTPGPAKQYVPTHDGSGNVTGLVDAKARDGRVVA